MSLIRVLIVDDHSVVRQGIHSLLSNYDEFVVVGEAVNGRQALTKIEQLCPDITLLDIRMPDQSGLEVMQQIKALQPDARVVMLTSFDDDEYVDGALRAGAKGYVLKSISDEMLVNAIHAVMRGERFLSPQVTERVVQRLIALDPHARAGDMVALEDDEKEALQLLVEGYSNAEIGSELFMSEATVKRKLRRIFEKMGVQSRAQAAAEAVRQRLV